MIKGTNCVTSGLTPPCLSPERAGVSILILFKGEQIYYKKYKSLMQPSDTAGFPSHPQFFLQQDPYNTSEGIFKFFHPF